MTALSGNGVMDGGRLTYRYSRIQEKISGSSSGRSILLLSASRNWLLIAAAKNGDKERTSSCAAKSRPSLPTVKVTIGEVRVLFIMLALLNSGCDE